MKFFDPFVITGWLVCGVFLLGFWWFIWWLVFE